MYDADKRFRHESVFGGNWAASYILMELTFAFNLKLFPQVILNNLPKNMIFVKSFDTFWEKIQNIRNLVGAFLFLSQYFQQWSSNLCSFLRRIIYSLFNPNGCAKLICPAWAWTTVCKSLEYTKVYCNFGRVAKCLRYGRYICVNLVGQKWSV